MHVPGLELDLLRLETKLRGLTILSNIVYWGLNLGLKITRSHKAFKRLAALPGLNFT